MNGVDRADTVALGGDQIGPCRRVPVGPPHGTSPLAASLTGFAVDKGTTEHE